MAKKILTLTTILILMLGITMMSSAEPAILGRRYYGIGWQFSRPASGFSVKIPIQEEYYLQPIFAISLTEKSASTTGHYALGIRAIYDLPNQQDFHPYIGAALGYSKSFQGTSMEDSTIHKGGTGYEVFFGVEYQKYLIHPALEIGLGGYNRFDQTHYAGLIVNLSVLYYF